MARKKSLDDVRELTLDQLSSYLHSGASAADPQPPAVWMWYVLEDAEIDYVDLADLYDMTRSAKTKAVNGMVHKIETWLDSCDDKYIRFYERAHVQEEARPE